MTPPTSTYRLQLTPDFGFAAARAIVPYLASLGVWQLYLSPVFEARRGSTHGYDVIDPTRIRGELGGETGFVALAEEARARGVGIVLDIVPNHLAATVESPWWRDVLEHGLASPYAEFFDVDWERPEGSLRGKVLLPILDQPLAETLAAGDLRLELRPVGPVLLHGDVALPLDPTTTPRILSRGAGTAWAQELPAPLAEVALVLERLPAREATPADGRGPRRARARAAIDTLWGLYQGDGVARHVIERALAAHDPAEVEGRQRLERLLAEQPWWPIPWRDADEEVNYRRFFAINDLVGLRVEATEVFDATHALVRRLIEAGWVEGLRVDHVDGLRDPAAYLERLRALVGPSVMIVVEKILGRSEPLRAAWPIEGTTGYDFLGMVNGLVVDPDGLAHLERDYGARTGQKQGFDRLAARRKRETARAHFAGALRALTGQLLPLVRLDPRGREMSASHLEEALLEVTVHLPVYRTYLVHGPPHPHDEASLDFAFSEARRKASQLPPEAFDVLEAVLRVASGERVEAIARWQQLSGAIMAKGVEDTAFYAYNPLISLNEVGSDPGFGTVSRAEFHAWCEDRAIRWPASMNATSTHDTKRSEDVRARIAVLSEIPELWAARLDHWRALNDTEAVTIAGERAPSPAREISLYQTLLGAWPLDPAELLDFRRRLAAYLPKAIREAEIRSRWEEPNAPYEDAVVRFALRLFDKDRFLADFLPFQEGIAFHGMVNSLTQILLKLCAPGVPDLYQGCESWSFSLVDPDNRRPVDFARLEAKMRDLHRASGAVDPTSPLPGDFVADLVTNWKDGRIKQLVTWRLLALRRAEPELFARGRYVPLEVVGPAAGHAIAFARRLGGRCLAVVAPLRAGRLVSPRAPALLDPASWSGTYALPPPGLEGARWTPVLAAASAAVAGRLPAGAFPAVHILA